MSLQTVFISAAPAPHLRAGLAASPVVAAPPAAAAAKASAPLPSALAAVAQRRRRSGRAPAVQLQATRTEWFRKVKRIGNDKAIFDVTIPKPMGVKIQMFPQENRKGMGVSEVVDDGNCDQVNRRVIIDEEPGMWVMEGDQLLCVDGVDVERGSIDDVVNIVSNNGKDEVTLTLLRDTRRGPVKIVMMPGGKMETVRRNCRLSAAGEYAKQGVLKYGCLDGWCGTCWHRERTTNGVFKPCSDLITEDWDSVLPMVLTFRPEKVGDAAFFGNGD